MNYAQTKKDPVTFWFNRHVIEEDLRSKGYHFSWLLRRYFRTQVTVELLQKLYQQVDCGDGWVMFMRPIGKGNYRRLLACGDTHFYYLQD